jgi:hypothetical protein
MGKKLKYKYHYITDVYGKRRRIYEKPTNTRVPCICEVRTANMLYNGVLIGTISEERNDAGEFDWVIRPNWKNIDDNNIIIQIAGIDMDLRLDEYIRTYIPAFVEERTLPDTRDRLYESLLELGLTWNDRFEYMCRTHGKCGCNDILVERQE